MWAPSWQRPLCPNQDVQWPQPTPWLTLRGRPADRVPQLNPRNCDVVSVHHALESPHLGISCYGAIDSWRTDKRPLACWRAGDIRLGELRASRWAAMLSAAGARGVWALSVQCASSFLRPSSEWNFYINEHYGAWLSVTPRKELDPCHGLTAISPAGRSARGSHLRHAGFLPRLPRLRPLHTQFPPSSWLLPLPGPWLTLPPAGRSLTMPPGDPFPGHQPCGSSAALLASPTRGTAPVRSLVCLHVLSVFPFREHIPLRQGPHGPFLWRLHPGLVPGMWSVLKMRCSYSVLPCSRC